MKRVARRDQGFPLILILLIHLASAVLSGGDAAAAGDSPSPARSFRLPSVAAEHTHARALLENALRYVDPAHGLIDRASGYPVEGWNHDPKRGLFLRSFTQLTAIGQYLELLANVVAGYADTPFLSREEALARMTKLVASLRHDQHDPTLAAEGLLGNFLDLATGKRLGPLAADVDKAKFLDAFGPEKGEAIWKALRAKGWIVPRDQDREAAIQRTAEYGSEHFDGPLAPFGDVPTREKILALLDQRVVMAVFGDNANLSASVAKAIGALLLPEIKDRPEIRGLRRELEQFLDDQKAGYARLYDPRAGLFDFGWDATRDRLFGWEDLQGNWTIGHMDYFVNEFRAPAYFVVLRYGLPAASIANLGFKIKPYRTADGKTLYAMAPWEGSAFQAMGLGVWLGELREPSWRTLLENVVAIQVDYATRHGLPGFLSESYTGRGTEYTGNVGIPEITVAPKPRITDAASLYTLGAAYTIAPARVEKFLAENWPVVSKLLTDHGPWEGYNVSEREIIPFQTTAHTLELVLGLLRTGSDHMLRYLESRDLTGRRAELFAPGGTTDLLAERIQVVSWCDKESTQRSVREGHSFRVESPGVKFLGIAAISNRPEGENLSGGRLRLRYRARAEMAPLTIELKPVADPQAAAGWISKEITTRLEGSGQIEEIEVPLPAMPGLAHVKEVVLTHEPKTGAQPVELSIHGLDVAPIGP